MTTSTICVFVVGLEAVTTSVSYVSSPVVALSKLGHFSIAHFSSCSCIHVYLPTSSGAFMWAMGSNSSIAEYFPAKLQ